jgi:hypothetical protein
MEDGSVIARRGFRADLLLSRTHRWCPGGVLFLLIVLGALGGAATPGSAQTLEQAVATLADRLTEGASLKGQEVALGDFEQGRGQFSELSVHVADLLEVALTNKQALLGFSLIRRDMRTDAVKEMRFGLSDVANAQKAQQLGELLSATVLVTGSITDRQNQVTLIGRLVDLGTTHILSAHTATLPKDAGIRALMEKAAGESGPPAPLPPAPPSAGAAPPAFPVETSQLRVRVWTDRRSYRVGESIRFYFMTSRDAYLTLINLGTSGRSTIIFPNAYSQGNFVRGGVTYSVPGPTDGFRFRIEAPPGLEIIRVIASDIPWSPSFQVAPPAGTVFRSLDPAEGRTLTRDIGVMQQERPPSQRTEEIVQIPVRP